MTAVLVQESKSTVLLTAFLKILASVVTFKAEIEVQQVSKFMECYTSYIIGLKGYKYKALTFTFKVKSLKKSGYA